MELGSSKALVTGAGGFIGSHLVEALLAEDCAVRAFVHYNSRSDYGHLEHVRKGTGKLEIVAADLRDYSAVRRAVEGCRFVFHLGALIGIPYSYLNPFDVVATNVGGTQNVLEAARECGSGKLIVTSTSEVYGTALYVPIDEKHPLQAQSPYAASKAAADKLAESYNLAFDLPVVIVRPFNTYGPRQSARAVIPTIAVQALTGKRIALGALDTSRDMLYVSDTVSGFLAAARHDGSVGRVINLGTGGEVTIKDLAELIIMITGSEAVIEQEPERLRPDRSEVRRLQCNCSLAQELLGWEAQVGLEDGLRQTIGWIEKHLGAYKAELYNV